MWAAHCLSLRTGNRNPRGVFLNVGFLSPPWAELPAPGSGTGELRGKQSQEGNLKVPRPPPPPPGAECTIVPGFPPFLPPIINMHDSRRPQSFPTSPVGLPDRGGKGRSSEESGRIRVSSCPATRSNHYNYHMQKGSYHITFSPLRGQPQGLAASSFIIF